MRPKALIIRTAGTNCDHELAHGFELAGAQAEIVHLNLLIAEPDLIDRAHLLAFPGGFSYGDDIAAGRIFAERLRHGLLVKLRAALARKVPIIGICNGFQVLLKLGLLPEPDSGRQLATLGDNDGGRFIDRWVDLEVPQNTVCLWTAGIESLQLPVAHGEGRFVANNGLLSCWQQRGQIALRYQTGANPNGSQDDVAGVCDASGSLFGLMPHPERFTTWTHHPTWTRLSEGAMSQVPAGLQILQNAVEAVQRASQVATP